jgi:hypothetical protein
MRYGDSVIRGPNTNWRKSLAPVMISPPTKVEIVCGQLAGGADGLADDAVAESRGEPLDLGDDGRSGIACVAVGHVRVGPYGMDVADRALWIG